VNTSVNTYLDELAAGLRSCGLTSDEADEIVREAASHVREAGGDPVETLGPLDEFVEAVVSRGAETLETSALWEHRTIEGATAFNEMRLLEEAGREGWELIGCAPLRLYCRRRPGELVGWEYRRKSGGPRLDAELARDGWKLATTWLIFRYYGRRITA